MERGKRGSGQASAAPQPPRQIIEEFQPSFDWTNDLNGHVLLVCLPGFKKDDLRVQVDNNGKIKVTGEMMVSENKCRKFNQVFESPKDSDIEKIRATFKHDHFLVIIPKKEDGGKEEPQKMIGNDGAEKQEKPTQKDEPKKEDAVIGADSSKKEEVLMHITIEDSNKEDGKHRQKYEHERLFIDSKKERDNERTYQGWWKEIGDGGGRNDKLEEEEGDFENGLVDKLLDQINKNKIIIATTILSFSLGMYVSRKLQ